MFCDGETPCGSVAPRRDPTVREEIRGKKR